jgi:hypothetical protein
LRLATTPVLALEGAFFTFRLSRSGNGGLKANREHPRAERRDGDATAVATDRHRRDAVLSLVTRGVGHDRPPTACRLLEAHSVSEIPGWIGLEPEKPVSKSPSDTLLDAKVLVLVEVPSRCAWVVT